MTPPATLRSVLDRHKDDIVRRFAIAMQRSAPSESPGLGALGDRVPEFLDDLIRVLGAGRGSQVAAETTTPESGQKVRLGGLSRLGPEAGEVEGMARRYGVLARCVLEALEVEGAKPSWDDIQTLLQCLNLGLAEAVSTRGGQVEELIAERERLDLLMDASKKLAGALDLEPMLSDLVHWLVPQVADCAVIRLEGQGAERISIAHVDWEKERLLEELYARYSSSDVPPFDGLGGSAQGARYAGSTSPSQFDMAAQDERHSEILRSLAPCSWITIPLRPGGANRGILVLAQSESKRRFQHRDLALAEDLGRRVSVALQNAQLHAALKVERARVLDARRAKDEFVSMVSHELRRPLNAVMGWTRLLRAEMLSAAKRDHALDVIERSTLAQGRSIDDLIDMSRILDGTLSVSLSQVDAAAIVESIVESARARALAKGLRLETAIGHGPQLVRADAPRLRQIVDNLLENAIKFTPRDGHVRLWVQHSPAAWELYVSDDGTGIAPEFLPRIFEPFRPHERTARGAGLGLGLAIVKRLVELHDGSVEVRSAGLGCGSVFVVRLPSAALPELDPTNDGDAALRPASGFVRPPGLEHLKVLVVDDEPDARELLSTILSTCGMNVRTAANASEAMNQVEQERPDVIVSDIGLPGDDGYSLIRAIRAREPEFGSGVPALALTAFSRNEDRARALESGFDAFATKPIEPAFLLMLVAQLVAKKDDPVDQAREP
ncbi:MAG TPA: ATP-binding protein [Polyangiaceae bacterium]